MPCILALDTSTDACSVALLAQQKLITRFEIAPQKHTQRLLPMIDEVIKEAGIHLSQLEAVAFGKGPGSFTGIRLAASVTQALAFAQDKPVISISTLAAMAHQAFKKHPVQYVVPILDARMGEVYWGVYDELIQGEDQLSKPEKIILPANAGIHLVGVGQGWEAYPSLKDRFSPVLQAVYPDIYPDARDIVLLAEKEFEQGKYVSAEEALPVYLREKITYSR